MKRPTRSVVVILLLLALSGLILVGLWLDIGGLTQPAAHAGAKTFMDLVAAKQSQLLLLVAAQAVLLVAISSFAFLEATSRADLTAGVDTCARWLDKTLGHAKGTSDPNQPAITSLKDLLEQLCLELSESRRREMLLIERAVDVICVVDMKGRIVGASPSCMKGWGYLPSELEHMPLGELLNPQDAQRILGNLVDASASIDSVSFESQVRCKNGKLRDVKWTGHWSLSEGGLFSIVHDISQQKTIEKSIRQSEHRLREALESLPAGVFAADSSGRIEFVNRTANRMLGYEPGQLMGINIQDIFEQQNLSVLDPPSEQGIETLARRRSGTMMPTEVWLSTIDFSSQTKYMVVFMDKTAQHEFERLKSEFIAMVTHDLRSPLTSVKGLLILLDKGVLGQISEQGKQIAARAHKECDRMLRLLSDMLELEKVEAGSFELQCAFVDMNHTVRDAIESVLYIADEKKVRIDASLRPVVCWGDEQRLMQVLVNLLSNAVKFSPAQSVIRVALVEDEESVLVGIQDSGPGIPADKIEKIFEKFEQVDPSDARQRGGIGLGLAICKAIVSQHGGSIGADSILGQGSRFWFTIPKQESQVGIIPTGQLR